MKSSFRVYELVNIYAGSVTPAKLEHSLKEITHPELPTLEYAEKWLNENCLANISYAILPIYQRI